MGKPVTLKDREQRFIDEMFSAAAEKRALGHYLPLAFARELRAAVRSERRTSAKYLAVLRRRHREPASCNTCYQNLPCEIAKLLREAKH